MHPAARPSISDALQTFRAQAAEMLSYAKKFQLHSFLAATFATAAVLGTGNAAYHLRSDDANRKQDFLHWAVCESRPSVNDCPQGERAAHDRMAGTQNKITPALSVISLLAGAGFATYRYRRKDKQTLPKADSRG